MTIASRLLVWTLAATPPGALAHVPSSAPDTESSVLAAQLVARLAERQLTAIAAQFPDDPSRFAAALHNPGTQLLLISARYPAPALLRELILTGDYQQAYVNLNSAADRTARFFVEDLGANGLQPDREPGEPFDITWREGTLRTQYDGKWAGQKLTKAEYDGLFAKDEAEYAQALEVLIGALRPTTAAVVP